MTADVLPPCGVLTGVAAANKSRIVPRHKVFSAVAGPGAYSSLSVMWTVTVPTREHFIQPESALKIPQDCAGTLQPERNKQIERVRRWLLAYGPVLCCNRILPRARCSKPVSRYALCGDAPIAEGSWGFPFRKFVERRTFASKHAPAC